MRGVALLARRRAIGFQDGVNEPAQWAHHRPLPLHRFSLGWFGAGQRLPHHPPMHFKLGRYALDGPNPELVLPPDLLEQLHLRSPLHPGPPASSAGCSGQRGWANLQYRKWANSEYRNHAALEAQREYVRRIEMQTDAIIPWAFVHPDGSIIKS